MTRRRPSVELNETVIDVQKHMAAEPRRIAKIDVVVTMPKLLKLAEKDQTILQRVGDNCPVVKSLHPEIILNITYLW